MRQLLVEQWRLTDQQLVARFRQDQAGTTSGDGYDPLKVVSRLGVVQLPRQVCYLPGAKAMSCPAMPAHRRGQVTPGFARMGLFVAADLPFGSGARLLGWMTTTRR
jgi:hypothetical protein